VAPANKTAAACHPEAIEVKHTERREWDLRSLGIGVAILVVVALVAFALGGCITVAITYPAAGSDAQAQTEPSAGASPAALEARSL
jgi:hypothetical protein